MKQLILLSLLIFSFGWGCSSGFQPDPLNQLLSPDPDSLGVLPPSEEDAQLIWESLSQDVTGYVSGGSYDGQLLVEIDPLRQAILLRLPLPPIFLAPLVTKELSLSGLKMEYQKTDNQYQLVLVVPIQYLIKGAQLDRYGLLPNGDPIPFIPSGEARGFAVNFAAQSKYRLHLYFVANAVAAFVETPDWILPEELSFLPTLGFPIYNQARSKTNGYFAIVPNKGVHASGVYIASRLPRELAAQLDQILRY